MYTDDIEMDAGSVMFVLYIAKKYMLNTLSQKCTDFLESQLSADNAAILLDQSLFFDDSDMIVKCLRKIRRNPSASLKADSIAEICQNTLNRILDVERLNIQEIEIFQACKMWANHRCKDETLEVSGANMRRILGESLEKIRFPLIPLDLFNSEVVESEILPPADENKLFRYLCPGSTKQKPNLPYSYDERMTPSPQMELYDQMKDTEKVAVASNAASTIELEISENIILQGLFFCDLTILPDGQTQNTSDVVISICLNGQYLGQMIHNSQIVSTNPDIKQLMFPFGHLGKGIHQVTLYIWQRTCSTCAQQNGNMNKANMYTCDLVHPGYQSYYAPQPKCGGQLYYSGQAVGFKRDSIKLDDEGVGVVIRNRNASYLPVCGILYTE